MDRLPTHKELVFERVRKTLYLRLTTVIRSLGTYFYSPYRELIWDYSYGNVRVANRSAIKHRSQIFNRCQCVLAAIREAVWFYGLFIANKSGDGRRIRKLQAAIERLEWLRDNWNDLEIVGDQKHGYELVLKSTKS